MKLASMIAAKPPLLLLFKDDEDLWDGVVKCIGAVNKGMTTQLRHSAVSALKSLLWHRKSEEPELVKVQPPYMLPYCCTVRHAPSLHYMPYSMPHITAALCHTPCHTLLPYSMPHITAALGGILHATCYCCTPCHTALTPLHSIPSH